MSYAPAIKAAVALALMTVPSYNQTPPKKAPPAQSKPDTWERSKACATQAEKVIKWLVGDDAKITWQNHYSPKYDRCFLKTWRMLDAKKVEDWTGNVSETDLYDAFERSRLANYVTAIPPSPRFESLCDIEDKEKSHEDCRAAADFIAEHLKN
jgi:hypothetical protein